MVPLLSTPAHVPTLPPPAVHLNHAWVHVPSSVLRSRDLHAPQPHFPILLLSLSRRTFLATEPLALGPCVCAYMCAHGDGRQRGVSSIHAHHTLPSLSFLSSLYLLPRLLFLPLFFSSSRLPGVLQAHLLAILEPKGPIPPPPQPLGHHQISGFASGLWWLRAPSPVSLGVNHTRSPHAQMSPKDLNHTAHTCGNCLAAQPRQR